VDELDEPVPGLDLPAAVVDKIFHDNAVALFPRSWTAGKTDAAAQAP
jgi:hypothetical protein